MEILKYFMFGISSDSLVGVILELDEARLASGCCLVKPG